MYDCDDGFYDPVPFIAQDRHAPDKLWLPRAEVLKLKPLPREYDVLSMDFPCKSGRGWGEKPEGRQGLYLDTRCSPPRARRFAGYELWQMMRLPQDRLLWLVNRGYSDDTIARLAMAAIAGPTGAPPACLAVNRAQQTLRMLAAQWSAQVPTLHLSAPASEAGMVRAVLLFATLHPVPVVAIGADGSLPGFSWSASDRGHDKAIALLSSWSHHILGHSDAALPFLVGTDTQASVGVTTLWLVVPLPVIPVSGLIPAECWTLPSDVMDTHLRRCCSLTIHKLQSFVGPSRALSDFLAARL